MHSFCEFKGLFFSKYFQEAKKFKNFFYMKHSGLYKGQFFHILKKINQFLPYFWFQKVTALSERFFTCVDTGIK